ncbi:CsbD family protein [Cyanobium sp. Morenito 9A2]|uniref:CsbD family protein n=1 Tax=Cyanobium sp. Morenito 9A2 TaxID=2823718 RepID=UPI0028F43DAD|nr:CsbD family protein [Cyanobium sp. Morenito 9A2]MCP9848722.1 CsbD family protein [Cyanobium sp. Morenito 9A2]
MNQSIRFLRQLAAFGLGLVVSLLALIATPLLNAPAEAADSTGSSAPHLSFAAGTVSSGRVKAVTKDVEGKIQESIGKVTGDRGDRLAGTAKQAEAQVRHALEDVKDTTGLR